MNFVANIPYIKCWVKKEYLQVWLEDLILPEYI